eukprot:TRINITY_DN6361_c1_g1_i1.p1 TRINITY_DN6361_c1_g1~~TRINITY_DN6361_c1_g1_i1.p1  ORF type:complete len:373 (+),score=135.71 TRINITY_DN6361_c1_g1_i1:71-1120(+)
MGAQRYQRKGCGSKRTEPNDIAGVPWASNVVGLGLGEEMKKYKEFMVPCSEEDKARSVVRAVVQETISALCPGATVKRCGAHGTNMASFQHGISLVVEDISECAIPLAIQELSTIDPMATSTGSDISLTINSIKTDIHLTPETKSNHRRLTAYLKREMQFHPNAEHTAFVLTSILESCKIISPTFTSTTFLVLVLGYAKMVGDEGDHGEFLKGFMEFISNTFSAKTHMVDIQDPAGIVEKPPFMDEDAFVIRDPVGGANLAADTPPMFPIRLRLTMQNCLAQMSVAESDLARRVPSSVGPRSVLSTVIAYHEFWPRTFKFQKEAKMRTNSPSVSFCATQSVVSSDDDSA